MSNWLWSDGTATPWSVCRTSVRGRAAILTSVLGKDTHDSFGSCGSDGVFDEEELARSAYTYSELGLDVPVRGDHVPEMEGDRRIAEDCIPGYSTLGRLFANGYLKALLKGTEIKA